MILVLYLLGLFCFVFYDHNINFIVKSIGNNSNPYKILVNNNNNNINNNDNNNNVD